MKKTMKFISLLLVIAMLVGAIAAFAINASASSTEQATVTIANNGYPYGKDMSRGSVTLVTDVNNADSTTTYQWQSASEKDGTYTDISGATEKEYSCSGLTYANSGTWYRCVVNGEVISKSVMLVYPNEDGREWTKPLEKFYISNGKMAYCVYTNMDGMWFDVVGEYVKNGTTYMLGTSYSRCWGAFSSTNETGSSYGAAGLDALRVSFSDLSEYAIIFEADLKDGHKAFAFGCDTQLGDGDTSGDYYDDAALIGKITNGKLTQVSMIGAASELAAKPTDPAFVIAPAETTLPTNFYIGYYGDRKPFAYNNKNTASYERNCTFEEIDGKMVATAFEGEDSGMTMSWQNVTSGGSVKFEFRVGSVSDTGAIAGSSIDASTGTFTLELTKVAKKIDVIVDGETLALGTQYTIADPGTLNPTITLLPEAGITHLSKIIVSVLFEGETTPKTVEIRNNIPSSFKITFDANEGVCNTTTLDTDGTGKLASLPTATKTGYTFDGWYNGTTKVDINTVFTANTTLVAKWTVNNYAVKFNANNGSGTMANQNFVYDIAQGLTLNTYTRTGYEFAGWATTADGAVVYGDGQSVEKLSEIDGAVVELYAVWGANDYAVKFDANNGSGTMANQAMTYDMVQKLAANQFTRTGYTFIGWSTTANGSVEYIECQSVKNLVSSGSITLYAVWEANEYTVKFDAVEGRGTMASQGFTYDEAQELNNNQFTRPGYDFVGWALTPNGKVEFKNCANVINLATSGEITLYAQWKIKEQYLQVKYYLIYAKDAEHGDISVARKNMPANTIVEVKVKADRGYELDTLTVKTKYGTEIKTNENANGTYSFIMPTGDVTISATFKKIEEPQVVVSVLDKFTDVNKSAWYASAVEYVVENNIMIGTSETTFAPEIAVNRAMIVTVLWRLEGCPQVNLIMPFTDVPAEEYYTEAVRWAAAEGIVNGFGDDTYKPTENLTREQLAAILYRYEQYKGGGFKGMWMFRLDYADAADVSDWAYEAVCWLTMNNIYVERDGLLVTKEDATRADVAATLKAYCEK